ncbi:MAG: hypothetical protein P8X86_18025 [Desulfofustis sp.]
MSATSGRLRQPQSIQLGWQLKQAVEKYTSATIVPWAVQPVVPLAVYW